MGIFIFCSFEALLFRERKKEPTLSKFPSARFKIFVDYQMMTISPFSGWGKGNVAQNDNLLGYGRKNFLHDARAVEVLLYFPSSRKPVNANV